MMQNYSYKVKNILKRHKNHTRYIIVFFLLSAFVVSFVCSALMKPAVSMTKQTTDGISEDVYVNEYNDSSGETDSDEYVEIDEETLMELNEALQAFSTFDDSINILTENSASDAASAFIANTGSILGVATHFHIFAEEAALRSHVHGNIATNLLSDCQAFGVYNNKLDGMSSINYIREVGSGANLHNAYQTQLVLGSQYSWKELNRDYVIKDTTEKIIASIPKAKFGGDYDPRVSIEDNGNPYINISKELDNFAELSVRLAEKSKDNQITKNNRNEINTTGISGKYDQNGTNMDFTGVSDKYLYYTIKSADFGMQSGNWMVPLNFTLREDQFLFLTVDVGDSDIAYFNKTWDVKVNGKSYANGEVPLSAGGCRAIYNIVNNDNGIYKPFGGTVDGSEKGNGKLVLGEQKDGAFLAPRAYLNCAGNTNGTMIAYKFVATGESHRCDIQVEGKEDEDTDWENPVDENDKITITVKKSWDDNGVNHDNDNVTVGLYSGNDIYSASKVSGVNNITLNKDNNWSASFDNLDKLQTGNYFVKEETNIDGYDISYTNNGINGTGTVIVKNTKGQPDTKISIAINKVWNDGASNHKGDKVTVGLYKGSDFDNSSKVNDINDITLESNNNWSATFDNLPQLSGSDKYFVKEIKINGADISNYKPSYSSNGIISDAAITITNEKLINIKVNKIWSDGSDSKNEVTVKLYKADKSGIDVNNINSSEIAALKLNSSNNWTASFENLPIKESNGSLIYYYVKEDPIPADYQADYSVNGVNSIDKNITITNIKQINLTVNKKWFNSDGIELSTPPSSSIEFELYKYKFSATEEEKTPPKDFIPVGTVKVGETITLNAANSWTMTINNLPTQEDGLPLYYYVKEKDVPEGYDVSYDGYATNGTITINNTKQADDKISITVDKAWSGTDYQNIEDYNDPVRLWNGHKIKVQLQQSTDNANWINFGDPVEFAISYTFSNLSKADENGQSYYYKVVEEPVYGYSASYSKESINAGSTNKTDSITITNELIKNKLKIKKNWLYSNSQYGPDNYIDKVVVDVYRKVSRTKPDISGSGQGGSGSGSVTNPTVNITSNVNSVEVGKSIQLTADKSSSLTWTSSSDEIATVDNNGCVTGVKAGSVTITVKYTENGKTATANVTVNVTNSSSSGGELYVILKSSEYDNTKVTFIDKYPILAGKKINKIELIAEGQVQVGLYINENHMKTFDVTDDKMSIDVDCVIDNTTTFKIDKYYVPGTYSIKFYYEPQDSSNGTENQSLNESGSRIFNIASFISQFSLSNLKGAANNETFTKGTDTLTWNSANGVTLNQNDTLEFDISAYSGNIENISWDITYNGSDLNMKIDVDTIYHKDPNNEQYSFGFAKKDDNSANNSNGYAIDQKNNFVIQPTGAGTLTVKGITITFKSGTLTDSSGTSTPTLTDNTTEKYLSLTGLPVYTQIGDDGYFDLSSENAWNTHKTGITEMAVIFEAGNDNGTSIAINGKSSDSNDYTHYQVRGFSSEQRIDNLNGLSIKNMGYIKVYNFNTTSTAKISEIRFYYGDSTPSTGCNHKLIVKDSSGNIISDNKVNSGYVLKGEDVKFNYIESNGCFGINTSTDSNNVTIDTSNPCNENHTASNIKGVIKIGSQSINFHYGSDGVTFNGNKEVEITQSGEMTIQYTYAHCKVNDKNHILIYDGGNKCKLPNLSAEVKVSTTSTTGCNHKLTVKDSSGNIISDNKVNSGYVLKGEDVKFNYIESNGCFGINTSTDSNNVTIDTSNPCNENHTASNIKGVIKIGSQSINFHYGSDGVTFNGNKEVEITQSGEMTIQYTYAHCRVNDKNHILIYDVGNKCKLPNLSAEIMLSSLMLESEQQFTDNTNNIGVSNYFNKLNSKTLEYIDVVYTSNLTEMPLDKLRVNGNEVTISPSLESENALRYTPPSGSIPTVTSLNLNIINSSGKTEHYKDIEYVYLKYTDGSTYTIKNTNAVKVSEPDYDPDDDFNDGEYVFVTQVVLDKNNNWQADLSDLPATDGHGNAYSYFIKEKSVVGKGADLFELIGYSHEEGIILQNPENETSLSNKKKDDDQLIIMPSTGGKGINDYRNAGIIMMTASAGIYIALKILKKKSMEFK